MAVIGVYGKANSGKDLVGNIIQYLTEGIDKANIPFEKWDGQTLWGSKKFDWDIVKYADPLKECIAIMLGCDRKDLEDRDFKESALPSTWQDHSPKDDPLTPRKVLTRFGTDFGRKTLSENIWINAVFAKYRPHIDAPEGVIPPNWESKWIITDVRFPNELEKIKSVGGFVIKVSRDKINYFKPKKGDKVWVNYLNEWKIGTYLYEIESQDTHACEIVDNTPFGGYVTLNVALKYNDILPIEAEPNNLDGPENALNDYDGFDYTIYNNSTIDHLILTIREILIKENII